MKENGTKHVRLPQQSALVRLQELCFTLAFFSHSTRDAWSWYFWNDK